MTTISSKAIIISALVGLPLPALALSEIQDGDQIVLVEPITGMNFIELAPGCFDMAEPSVEICLDGFALGRFEVTNQEFRKFVPDHDSGQANGIDLNLPELPVVNVSWIDANRFAGWLSAESGLSVRLPSEAEWEYAAMGGAAGDWFWGSDPQDAFRYANLSGRDASDRLTDGFVATSPIASFDPNPLGLFDMLGNASEWVFDAYSAELDRYAGQTRNPVVASADTPLRVRRGGSYDQRVHQVGVKTRDFYLETLGVPQTGFRLVLELPR